MQKSIRTNNQTDLQSWEWRCVVENAEEIYSYAIHCTIFHPQVRGKQWLVFTLFTGFSRRTKTFWPLPNLSKQTLIRNPQKSLPSSTVDLPTSLWTLLQVNCVWWSFLIYSIYPSLCLYNCRIIEFL